MIVNTPNHTYVGDFGRATLVCDGQERTFKAERDCMYLAQHRAVLSGDFSKLCSLADGEAVMRLIEATERSAAEGRWIAA